MAESRFVKVATAASSTLTNTTTETVLDSYTIPADAAVAGKVYRFAGACVVPDNNSTDTLQIRVRFGGTTLTGTAILDSGAVDVADADICRFQGEIVFRGKTSSESVACFGSIVLDAPGTAMVADGEVVASIDATADLLIEVTGEWSVAHADNQVALQSFYVEEATVS